MLKKLIFITVFISFALAVSAGQFKIVSVNDSDTTVKAEKHDKPVKIVKPETKKQKNTYTDFYTRWRRAAIIKEVFRVDLTGEDLYWFFSTIAQTLGAIVGVVGMLTVFRLQNLTTSMQHLLDSIFIERRHNFGGEKSYNQTPEVFVYDFIKEYPNIDTTSPELEASSSLRNVYDVYRQILRPLNTYKKIKFRFLTIFFPPQLFVIFLSLALLPFSRKLVITVDSQSFMLYFIFAVLLYLLVSTAYMIRLLMKPEFIAKNRIF